VQVGTFFRSWFHFRLIITNLLFLFRICAFWGECRKFHGTVGHNTKIFVGVINWDISMVAGPINFSLFVRYDPLLCIKIFPQFYNGLYKFMHFLVRTCFQDIQSRLQTSIKCVRNFYSHVFHRFVILRNDLF